MEYLFIYLLQIGTVFEVAAVLFGLGFVALTIWTILCFVAEKTEDCDDLEWTKKWGKTTIITLCITLVLSLFPAKQTLLLMGATYYGKKAVNSIVTNEKLKKIDTIINLELDKRIKELKG